MQMTHAFIHTYAARYNSVKCYIQLPHCTVRPHVFISSSYRITFRSSDLQQKLIITVVISLLFNQLTTLWLHFQTVQDFAGVSVKSPLPSTLARCTCLYTHVLSVQVYTLTARSCHVYATHACMFVYTTCPVLW